MARKLAAIAFSLGCLHAGAVFALGLGDVRLESFLNEPLRASVDLLNLGGLHEDEIKIRLATTEDFAKLGVERNYFLTSIKFDVVADGHGGARILISSEEPVLEPYLDFIVEARWPSGRLIREYTVLVDPQVFSKATPVVSASKRVEEVEGIQAPAKKNGKVTAKGAAHDEEDDTLGAWGTEGGSGGTHVGVRGAELAPGAMPHRNYNAATSDAPAPGSRYMVHRDQTLWDIASRAKPAGASVHQTMLDIQRLNPDAFINGNINRIKAGYIIYIPSAGEISSGNDAKALSEVSQQNQAWREGRDNEAAVSTRPKLTISAEPEEIPDTAATGKGVAGGGGSTPQAQSIAGATVTNKASMQGGDTDARLAALEQQLQELQRIVTLKDDQIAALQSALAKSNGTAAVGTDATPTVDETAPTSVEEAEPAPAEEEATTVPAEPARAVVEKPVTDTVPGEVAANEQGKAEAPAAAPKKSTAESKKAPPSKPETMSGSSWTSYLPYILGALVLAVGGFLFAKRRSDLDEDDETPVRQAGPKEDVFSAVRLQEQNLVLKPAPEETEALQPTPTGRDNRGYGERKHDEYASDFDSADALAEADIYIAYGRHQQAIDLLNNALANEPGNPVYRLKLIEIYAERKNRVGAATQMEKLQATGDSESIARAESLMANLDVKSEPEYPQSNSYRTASDGPGLSPNPLAMMKDSDSGLEADFTGLEIEETPSDDEELDLSRDFVAAESGQFEDEELVIAADSNGLSTKLDLARAYLDMGDDDGARQILDEVVAEGSDDLKAEARALLPRIGG
jgi:pilus assembly protein FimV